MARSRPGCGRCSAPHVPNCRGLHGRGGGRCARRVAALGRHPGREDADEATAFPAAVLAVACRSPRRTAASARPRTPWSARSAPPWRASARGPIEWSRAPRCTAGPAALLPVTDHQRGTGHPHGPLDDGPASARRWAVNEAELPEAPVGSASPADVPNQLGPGQPCPVRLVPGQAVPARAAVGPGREFAFTDFYRATTPSLIAFLVWQGARRRTRPRGPGDDGDGLPPLARPGQPARVGVPGGPTRLIRRLTSTREEPFAEPPEPSPLVRATAIEHWEQHHDIARAVTRLPPRQRQVMAWTLAGSTPAEIAAELGLKAETVRSHPAESPPGARQRNCTEPEVASEPEPVRRARSRPLADRAHPRRRGRRAGPRRRARRDPPHRATSTGGRTAPAGPPGPRCGVRRPPRHPSAARAPRRRTWLPRLELAARALVHPVVGRRAGFDHDLARARDTALTERIEHRLAARPSTDDLVRLSGPTSGTGPVTCASTAGWPTSSTGRCCPPWTSASDSTSAGPGTRARPGPGLDLAVAVDSRCTRRSPPPWRSPVAGRRSTGGLTRCGSCSPTSTDVRRRRAAWRSVSTGRSPATSGRGFVGPLVRRLNTVRAAVRDVVFAVTGAWPTCSRSCSARGATWPSTRHAAGPRQPTTRWPTTWRPRRDGPRPHDDRSDAELVDAVDRIEDAATNLVDADLAHVPLDGIPLTGPRAGRRGRGGTSPAHDRSGEAPSS